MSRLVVLAWIVSVLGCASGDPLGPRFVERLTAFGGCGDIVLYAADSADELMLSFRAEDVLVDARSAGAGEETVTVFALPSEEAQLVLEQGTKVSDATCDDVIENGGPQVSRTWTAVSGTAVLVVRPEEGRATGRADLLVQDIVLETEGDERVTFERLEWTDVFVGWYAG